MAEIKNFDLDKTTIRVRWEEPYVSRGLNEKLFAVNPPGIYRGFLLGGNISAGTLAIKCTGIGADSWYSSALLYRNGYAITVRQAANFNITSITMVPGNYYYVLLDAAYNVGADSTAQIVIVDQADFTVSDYRLRLGRILATGANTGTVEMTYTTRDEPIFPHISYAKSQMLSGTITAGVLANVEKKTALLDLETYKNIHGRNACLAVADQKSDWANNNDHDGRYYTETEMGASGGAAKVGFNAAAAPHLPGSPATVQAALNVASPELPVGTILMFNGAFTNNVTLVGWYICDGTNGTPNLVDKFIKGGSSSGATGGSATHLHAIDILSGVENNIRSNVATGGTTNLPDEPHRHQVTGNSAASSSEPPYYKLIFIMRVS